MTDPLRTDRPPAAWDVPERDRDARVEELLLAGLDHYFSGHYDLAISVWTRVLFLDRGHPRAKAYIERARGAIAERQREVEELVHTGAAAFDRGDAGAARRLLTSAVERGAATDEALALLYRLNRLEPGAVGEGPLAARRGLFHPPGDTPGSTNETSAPSRLAWIATGLVAGLVIAGAAAWLWVRGADWLPLRPEAAPDASFTSQDHPLPVPAPSQASLTRSRALYERGRLRDALTALEGIQHGDPLRAPADDLRARIQRDLLATAQGATSQTPGTPPPRP